MTSSKTKVTYYNGIWWYTEVQDDGTRRVQPLRVRDGELAPFGATRYYRKPGKAGPR